MSVQHRTTAVLLWHHANIVQVCESNLAHYGGASLWVEDDVWQNLTNEQKSWHVSKTQMEEWESIAELHRKILDMLGLDTDKFPFDKVGDYLINGDI